MIKLYSLSFLFFFCCISARADNTNSLPKKQSVKIKSSIPTVTNFVNKVEKNKKVETAKPMPTRLLVQKLQTQDVSVIINTVRQIGKQDKGSKYVLKEFSRLLNHPMVSIRQEVLDAAFSFDVLKPLLPALAKCLNDPVEEIRQDAADIIGDIETREMINIFVSALTNQFPDVRENADFYLQFWTDEEFTNSVDWIKWWEKKKNTFVFD